MDVKSINTLLSQGETDRTELWPHIAEMKAKSLQFTFEFGLDSLPEEPGLIVIRGPRQYGKSTWLELRLKESIETFGKGSAYYLNGDELASADELYDNLVDLDGAYSPDAHVKRLFIDEITAIASWEKGLKRALDQGLLQDVLIVTTGSKAFDLRRGAERLPGRKGKLSRTDYIFLPISYREFHDSCHNKFKEKTWIAYLMSGGSPLACNDLWDHERLQDYFIQLTRDWIFGEIISSGRGRLALTNLFHVLFQTAGQPLGFAKLAREAGLANNTVASGYIEQLSDLLCVLPTWPWDHVRKILQPRKACKFQFINSAAAITLHPSSPRTVSEFEILHDAEQGQLLEWLVAQELWRRGVLARHDNPEAIGFWSSKEHEVDFVSSDRQFVEVKKGRAGPLDFSWFDKIFPNDNLTVICKTPFKSKWVTGVTIEDYLLRK